MALPMRMPNPIHPHNITAPCKIVPSSPTRYSSSSSSSFKPALIPLPDRSGQSRRSVAPAATTSKPVSDDGLGSRRSNTSTLPNTWREIHGSNNWDNLKEPLNPLLRDEIIRYGQLITACYKAFNLDPNSKRYLHCKYGKKNMLKEAGVVDSGYEVTKYIYATSSFKLPTDHSEVCCSRWLGYVAVSSSEEQVKKLGRRDIAIVFRGTVTSPEWIANFMSSLTPARLDPLDERPDVKVESGFLHLYTSGEGDINGNGRFGTKSCREQLLSEVCRIINEYKGEEISITVAGHSMGSSIALLLAYDIAELGLNKSYGPDGKGSVNNIPIAVYSFGGPRVGNYGFKVRCEELGIKVLRIVNVNDPVTKLPGVIFNENFNLLGGYGQLPWRSSCYAHVGAEIALDFFNMQNPTSVHDLDTYIISLLKESSSSRRAHRAQKNKGIDIINKAKNSLFSMKKLDTWQWKNLVF